MGREKTILRRSRLGFNGTLLCAAIAIAAGQPQLAQAADVIEVVLDKAKIVSLPDRTATIIIGNPIIADVTLLKKNNQMILTGKGFGETNLIALDSSGVAVGESILRVKAAQRDLLVQRGLDQESYTCAPKCQPTITLGDTAKFAADTVAQIQTRNAAASAR